MREFDGLTAIVTGGASGLGAATASLLLERGARVAILDRSIEGAPSGVLAVECDVTDSPSVDHAIVKVVAEFGGIDIVVNNAGIGAAGDVAANDDAEWMRVLDVNVIGMARVSRAALPHLRRSQHAVIINTCSAVAFVGVPSRALYSATKGAVAALTLAMAADHVAEGIRVNAVAPGTADTPWVARILEAAAEPDEAAVALKARQPLGRLVTAPEVAHAICSLASPAAASTTGTILRVDGGMTTLRVPPR
ncbi:MAG: SDR family NAD(P)-dependent oxidoreductase [Candidatus Nanopelagicales bacterium]|jgi:NAD(P)-dependent dehydrogenase (short-subunit alcohol dehydrogenase family)